MTGAGRPGGPRGAAGAGGWVLGVDSGGSGLRVALARTGRSGGPEPVSEVLGSVPAEPVPTGTGGMDAGELLARLLPAARELLAVAGADAPVAAAVGAAGMATLGDELRAVLPGALREALGVRGLALAADAVTAYAGALGQRPGAVVAGGTGLIALGTDLTDWRRADGWGHLLGDCGSGAWIGRSGLEAALRAHDGRRGGSAALLARARARFGPVTGLPGQVYPRADRPAVLASFAPEVAGCAADGDPVAGRILAAAARAIAEAAGAVCPSGPAVGGTPEVALTGGLFKLGEPLLVPLRQELAGQLPGARTVPAAGDPLAGALAVAAALAGDGLRLPVSAGLLDVFGE
ncbi:ATPase [Streptomyces sp. LP05-1]|uniref:ATPase n=1 Tax=Streptomyces pyxinae TaxID=2970734 RepID=A0ABT2CHR0_9ACTN|nr:BadF/BadG/BcrA/BcrD ATPase family protein [Streptomyces sp. LP05-1]MCS0636952.1 ATPase [Streptomyces sp. LP05-1]